MTVPSRYFLAAAAGLWMTLPLPAQEPIRLDIEPGRVLAPAPQLSENQKLASAIAEQIRQSGRLHHYAVNVNVLGSTAELTGTVADLQQREEAVRIARAVSGVAEVTDHLTVSAITQVHELATAQEPAPMPQKVPALPGPVNTVEPAPIYQAPAPGPFDVNQPKMPPYAWPTYAPYNNYSRVAYPQAYPYQAWPFIGPCYPFPRVPLGWRSVKLQWQDGHWWFSKVASPHDWWHLRYW